MQANPTIRGLLQACGAMSLVGGAVTASAYLGSYPRLGAQGVRYAAAALLLLVLVRATPRLGLIRPVGREWCWLVAAATAGLSGYNLVVVQALVHAEPTVVATVVSGVPLVLAIAVPLASRRRVPPAVFLAAVAVVVGAVIVQGGGRSDAAGIGLSVLALVGESAFTVLSVPVLGRLGAVSVATHTTWIASVQLVVLAAMVDGRHAFPVPHPSVVLAIGYLVVASVVAFTLWFLAVEAIGGALAGLAPGVIPVSAAMSGLPFGLATVDARMVAGTLVVMAGVAGGARFSSPRAPRGPRAAGRPAAPVASG